MGVMKYTSDALEALDAHNLHCRLHLPMLVANSLLDKRAAVRVNSGRARLPA